MTDQAPIVSPSLVARVKGIILRPNPEWDIIDREPATVRGLFTGYAMILAAIGPLAGLIGGIVFNHSVVGSLIAAIVQYVLSLVGIFLLSIVIDALAPSFGGTPNRIQATKVAVYSWTASWLAGVFAIVPAIAFLSILGLYSLYLLFLGLPKLMRAPQDKALVYTIVVVVIAIVIWIVIGAITGAVLGAFLLAGAAATGGL